MSKPKTKKEIQQHKTLAIQALSCYLDSLINAGDNKTMTKADKLSYWLKDWTTFLGYEPSFEPTHLRRYKRGEIIKVHLGFNIGSEEGGLHYAVVLDKENPKSSPVITVVPLTSVKPQTDISKLKSGSIFLGNELFTSLNSKISATNKHLTSEIGLLSTVIENMSDNNPGEERKATLERIERCEVELNMLHRMRSEILKMKKGSIALVNQITTISKIRIYDPKTDHDVLSGIRLSNEKLDLLDAAIKSKFTNL